MTHVPRNRARRIARPGRRLRTFAPATTLALALLGATAGRAAPADVPPAADEPAEDAGTPEPAGDLALRDALALALARSPELHAAAAEARARAARAEQAGRPPNPELHATLEDVAGSGQRTGVEQSETTVRLSQLVELGGKRGRRRRLAALGTDLAVWDAEAARRRVVAETTVAFVRVLAAQARLASAVELERFAERAVGAAEALVAAGASPGVETARARVAAGNAALARRRAEVALEAARRGLAGHWAGVEPTFGRAVGDLARLVPPPAAAEAARALERHPEWTRWGTEVDERDAALALERAERVPDVTVGAGGRHYGDTGDHGAVFELRVALPVFDQNAGAVAEAAHRLAKARAERRAARVGLRAALADALARLAAAHERATQLRDDVLPAARASVDGTLEAYRKGRLRQLDVLDAERTRFELEADWVEALEAYHLARVELERLIAGPPAGGGAPEVLP
jgi:cobalt-zinc-cadmium efflux system outer membrane protein